jgi:hypothetical protein
MHNKSITVTVKKDDKELTKAGEVKQYDTHEELVKTEYKNDLNKLLAVWNNDAEVRARAALRNVCYAIIDGPSKAVYVFARKVYADATKFGVDIEPRKAFDIAINAYSPLFDVLAVEYDETKILGEEEPE